MIELTPTQQKILFRLIDEFAFTTEKEMIQRELNGSVPEPVVVDRPDKPNDLEVRQARKALAYMVDHGYSLEAIAAICNSHINWPGKKRETSADSLNSLLKYGYSWTAVTGKWSPYIRLDRCAVVVQIITAIRPEWDADNEFASLPLQEIVEPVVEEIPDHTTLFYKE